MIRKSGYRFSEKIMLHLNDMGAAGLKGQQHCRDDTPRCRNPFERHLSTS
jgi:hypothetical protein